MARLLVADDTGIPWVEIVTDELGARAATCDTCRWRSACRPFDPIADHIDAAELHVDLNH